jgi:hypothetical protein
VTGLAAFYSIVIAITVAIVTLMDVIYRREWRGSIMVVTSTLNIVNVLCNSPLKVGYFISFRFQVFVVIVIGQK